MRRQRISAAAGFQIDPAARRWLAGPPQAALSGRYRLPRYRARSAAAQRIEAAYRPCPDPCRLPGGTLLGIPGYRRRRARGTAALRRRLCHGARPGPRHRLGRGGGRALPVYPRSSAAPGNRSAQDSANRRGDRASVPSGRCAASQPLTDQARNSVSSVPSRSALICRCTASVCAATAAASRSLSGSGSQS